MAGYPDFEKRYCIACMCQFWAFRGEKACCSCRESAADFAKKHSNMLARIQEKLVRKRPKVMAW